MMDGKGIILIDGFISDPRISICQIYHQTKNASLSVEILITPFSSDGFIITITRTQVRESKASRGGGKTLFLLCFLT